jgi:hypothetical protein
MFAILVYGVFFFLRQNKVFYYITILSVCLSLAILVNHLIDSGELWFGCHAPRGHNNLVTLIVYGQ